MPEKQKRQSSGKNPPSPVVAIGAGAGGIEALREFLETLPPSPGYAVVVVQHMDSDGDDARKSVLSRLSPLPVSIVGKIAAVEPNRLYLVPARHISKVDTSGISAQELDDSKQFGSVVDSCFQSLPHGFRTGLSGLYFPEEEPTARWV